MTIERIVLREISYDFFFCFFSTEEEKDSWVEAIQNAIDLREKNRQTFINAAVEHESSLPENSLGSPTHKKQEEEVIDISDAELGTRAPRWVKDHEVTMCMICSKAFNKLLRRRHHCRACGRVSCKLTYLKIN